MVVQLIWEYFTIDEALLNGLTQIVERGRTMMPNVFCVQASENRLNVPMKALLESEDI